jgi:hypothetical protein
LKQTLRRLRNLPLNVSRGSLPEHSVPEAKTSDRSYIPLKVPAVLLQVSDERCADPAGQLLGHPPGLHQLGPHLLAVLPIPGDPGDVEEAVRIAQRLRPPPGDWASISPARSSPMPAQTVMPEVVPSLLIGEAIARLAVASNFLGLNNVDAALDEARHAHFELSLLGDAEQLLGRIALRQKQFDPARHHIGPTKS